MRYDRVIFSGTRRPLSEVDRRRVQALVLHYAGLANCTGCGDCPTGVDVLVRELLGGDVRVFEADWQRLGRRAGPERSWRMVAWAAGVPRALLVAAPCPASAGTWDAIRQAVAAGVRVVIEPVGR